MRFSKKFSYKLSKPFAVLALAGSGLVMGCSKDDPKNDIVPQHDTVYTFAPGDNKILNNYEQISASADSVEVRYVIFEVQSGERGGWRGMSMKPILEKGLKPAFEAAKGKGRGRGTFENVSDVQASNIVEPEFNALGFQFEYYKPVAQAMQKVR